MLICGSVSPIDFTLAITTWVMRAFSCAAIAAVAPRVSTATKPVKTATADPLAPLPSGKPKAKGSAPKAPAPGLSPRTKTKDSVTD